MEVRASMSEADGLAAMRFLPWGSGAAGSGGGLVGDDVLGDEPAARPACKCLLGALGVELGLVDVRRGARVEVLARRGQESLGRVAFSFVGHGKLPPTHPVV